VGGPALCKLKKDGEKVTSTTHTTNLKGVGLREKHAVHAFVLKTKERKQICMIYPRLKVV
jgi:hypothetical protein